MKTPEEQLRPDLQPDVTVDTSVASSCGEALQNIQHVINPLSDDKEHHMYDLLGFQPIIIDEDFLRDLGITSSISDETARMLREGSERFKLRYEKQTLTPSSQFHGAEINFDNPLEVHNYTGMCPTFVYELTPSEGACSIACQYCLVSDGDHCQPTVVWGNYPEHVRRILDDKKDERAFYYFSPKTEALAESHLQMGIVHGVLGAFDEHYREYPDSKARMFMATKGGPTHFQYRHDGETVIDCLSKLSGKVQVNGSIGIMPSHLRDVLEPNAPSIEDRLEALKMCQQQGLFAESVLAQPLLLPYMQDETLHEYFGQLSAAGIRNIKPEFLTVDIPNLVAIAQFVHHFDPELLKELMEGYVHEENQNHLKQRSRLAPDRKQSIEMLKKLQELAAQYDISISICNWVKSQLVPLDPSLAEIDSGSKAQGYRCLGYQTNILK